MSVDDTIFALSSGLPPAAIAVVRLSGRAAASTLRTLTNQKLPQPRLATVRVLRDPTTKSVLDHALTLFLPGPESVTGEDVVELQLHGGRAVVAAVLDVLSRLDGLRPADAGEFTRRAFENQRIDLAMVEGLADLVSAETEAQRRSAIAQYGGSIHRMIEAWVIHLVQLSAQIEADIDFNDEDDVQVNHDQTKESIRLIVTDMKSRLAQPPAERLHSGVRVAIIGPPNAGKSTLLNRLVSREAALVTNIPGTTRDVIEVHSRLGDIAVIFIDTAGIRSETDDHIEMLGIAKSEIEIQTADIILALGGWDGSADARVIKVAAKSDLRLSDAGLPVSAKTGEGMAELVEAIMSVAKGILPSDGGVALNSRHRFFLASVICELDQINSLSDELLIAEQLRLARQILGKIVGGTDTEAMLDSLFRSFCIGK